MRGTAARALLKLAELGLRGISDMRRSGRADALTTLFDVRTDAQRESERAFEKGGTVACYCQNSARLVVVVPFRDGWEMTERCLATIATQRLAAGVVCRVVLVDNGSSKEATKRGLESWFSGSLGDASGGAPQCRKGDVEFRYIYDDRPFNFSTLNNGAVAASKDFNPDLLFFVNNDLEFRSSDDLTAIVDFMLQNANAGAVGGTLLYPDNTIQHLFLAPGIKIVAAHPGKGEPFDARHPWFASPRAVPAVTGALLAVHASDFEAVGGFEERLASCGQDLDLCLKLEQLGRQNWVLPRVVATHYEGKTRGFSFDRGEIEFIYRKWGAHLTHHPQLSPQLSRWSEKPALTLGEGNYPWWWLL